MQVFGNVATQPERKKSKTTGKDFFEFRLAESQRGVDASPTWYTVRVMREANPELDKGDFVKVTGKLKTDFYLSREGKPTGTLLIIAFEAAKIAKPAGTLSGLAPDSHRKEPIRGEPVATRGKDEWVD
jgi:single-stranded DNA-binding protein